MVDILPLLFLFVRAATTALSIEGDGAAVKWSDKVNAPEQRDVLSIPEIVVPNGHRTANDELIEVEVQPMTKDAETEISRLENQKLAIRGLDGLNSGAVSPGIFGGGRSFSAPPGGWGSMNRQNSQSQAIIPWQTSLGQGAIPRQNSQGRVPIPRQNSQGRVPIDRQNSLNRVPTPMQNSLGQRRPGADTGGGRRLPISPPRDSERRRPEAGLPVSASKNWDRSASLPSSPSRNWNRSPSLPSSSSRSWERLPSLPASSSRNWDRSPSLPASSSRNWNQSPSLPTSPSASPEPTESSCVSGFDKEKVKAEMVPVTNPAWKAAGIIGMSPDGKTAYAYCGECKKKGAAPADYPGYQEGWLKSIQPGPPACGSKKSGGGGCGGGGGGYGGVGASPSSGKYGGAIPSPGKYGGAIPSPRRYGGSIPSRGGYEGSFRLTRRDLTSIANEQKPEYGHRTGKFLAAIANERQPESGHRTGKFLAAIANERQPESGHRTGKFLAAIANERQPESGRRTGKALAAIANQEEPTVWGAWSAWRSLFG